MDNAKDIPQQDTGEADKAAAPAAVHGKTTGEKWFGRLRFFGGEGFILIATAVIAYFTAYGNNPLRRFQDKFHNTLLDNKLFSLGKSDIGIRVAGAAASTTLTSWGGNFFAPVMKWLEDSKERIVTAVNRKHGKPGEVETGQENVRREPKRTWGDIIKGRIGGWFVIFASFLSIDLLAGRDPKTLQNGKPMYRFDKFTEWFGRWTAGFTRKSNPLADISLGEKLPLPFAEGKRYHFGKILALDIYATAAAILVWVGLSKFFAGRRARKAAAEIAHNTVQSPSGMTIDTAETSSVEPPRSYAADDRNQPKESHRARREDERAATSEPNMAMV